MFKIKLKDDKKVIIDPENMKKLPISGKTVRAVNSFWRNRYKDGDIEIIDLSVQNKKSKKEK
jgi:hypothetical protein